MSSVRKDSDLTGITALLKDLSPSEDQALWGLTAPVSSPPNGAAAVGAPSPVGEVLPPLRERTPRKAIQIGDLAVALARKPIPTSEIVYTHAVMAQLNLPRSRVDPESPEAKRFERRSGGVSFLIQPGDLWTGKEFETQELPYGPMPRIVWNYLNTYAIQNRTQMIDLKGSASDFMKHVGLSVGGGKRGTYTTFKQQTKSLAAARITMGSGKTTFKGEIISEFEAWFTDDSRQGSLWPGRLILSDSYYNTLITSAVPLDSRVTMAFRSSALALDIYSWLAYRLRIIPPNESCEIPWAALKQQFGQEYENNAQGRKNFQTRFLHQLRTVKEGYRKAIVTERKTRQGGSYGLVLRYSPPPVPPRRLA